MPKRIKEMTFLKTPGIDPVWCDVFYVRSYYDRQAIIIPSKVPAGLSIAGPFLSERDAELHVETERPEATHYTVTKVRIKMRLLNDLVLKVSVRKENSD